MSIRIKPKRTNVGGRVPTTSDIEIGEIAVNMVDKKIYTHEPNGTIIELSPTLSDSETRALFSASGDISYNSTTGEFTFTGTSGGTSYTDSDVETYLTDNNTIDIEIDGTINASRLTVSKDGSTNGRALDAINNKYANSTLVDGTRSLYVDFSVEDSTGVKQLAVFDCGYDTANGHDFGVYGALDGVNYLKAKKDEAQLCGGKTKFSYWGDDLSISNTAAGDIYFSQKAIAWSGFEVNAGTHTKVDTLEATGLSELDELEVSNDTTVHNLAITGSITGTIVSDYLVTNEDDAKLCDGKAKFSYWGNDLSISNQVGNNGTGGGDIYFSQKAIAWDGFEVNSGTHTKVDTLEATGETTLDSVVMPSADSTSMPTGTAGNMVMVSDNSYKPAYFDGTDWRYVSDNTTV